MINILLIEDSPSDASLLKMTLDEAASLRFELTHVEYFSQALRHLAERQFDLVLLDLSLPDSHGLDTLANITPLAGSSAIIVLTGLDDESLATKAMQAGAQDYLVKGRMNDDTLIRAIRYAMERQRLWVELQKQMNALQQSEARLHNIIAHNADGIVIVNQEGRVCFVNPAAERLFARPAQSLVGESIGFPIVADNKTELDILRNRNEKVIAEMRVVETTWDGSRAFVASLRDISERKQVEAELAQRAAQLVLINHIGSQLVTMLELDRLLDRVADLIEKGFGYHLVTLFLIEDERARLKAVAGSYRTSFPPDHSQSLDLGIIGWVGRHGQKVVANDISTDPRYVALMIGQGLTQAELCLPIQAAGRVVGILDIQSPHRNTFGENDVIAMETLTDQIAVSIENARLYQAAQQELARRRQVEQEVQRRNRELALLNQIISAGAAGLETEMLLDITCRELALAFNLPRATATLLDEQQTALQIVAEYRAESQPWAVNNTVPGSGDIPLDVRLHYEGPLVVQAGQSDPGLAPIRDWLCRRGSASLLLLPLRVEGEIVGALSLEAQEPHTFSTEEINLAWNVVEQVAGALSRARLSQVQQRLSTAIEQAAESIIITDPQGTIVYANPAFERTSGYNRAEAIGQTPRILKSDQHEATFYREVWATISAGQVWRGRFINRRKDGTLNTQEATITPVCNDSGGIVSYVSVQYDITHELQLEEQYRHAQKMEAVGRLTAGVAHDFNNLLTTMNGFAHLIHAELRPDDPIQEMTEIILRSGQRAADLVRQLLVFSRKQVLQPEVLNLNNVIVNIEQMLRRLIREDIDLVTVPDANLGQVKADPGQIEQVIFNLVVNARDAMPHGGRLTLKTANVELDQKYTRDHVGVASGRYVMLAVSDTGIGMDAEIQSHIFEPFFTTKVQGKGTGLGLATVFGIVQQSEGDIRVDSNVGQGTTVKIYLPRVDEAVATLEVHPDYWELCRGTETVLLVEDEAGVRSMTRQALELSGYTVLEASQGQEALRLYEYRQSKPVHLLVTDVVLPGGLSGLELAERLKLIRPGLRVLFMSGYTDEDIVQHGILEPGLSFLQKPFPLYLLLQKIRQVLDAPAGEPI